jgi:hypothetical protein
VERTLWYLGLEDTKSASRYWCIHFMEFATLSQMFFWDMIVLLFSAFSSLYLVFGMLVIARKRYLFLLEWSSCFKGNSFFTLPASNPQFFICLTAWRIGEREFLFLSKSGPLRYYGPCSFVVPSAFFTTVTYWMGREEQESTRVVGKKRREMETAHYSLMLMNTCFTFN